MYTDAYKDACRAARSKADLLRGNPLGYFLASMLAGVMVGLGMMLIFTIGGLLEGAPHTRVVMGACFGVALSLVTVAGAELFTGNNLVMTMGALEGTVSWGETAKLWAVCYLGNWLGAVALAFLYWGTGLAQGPAGPYIAASAAAKMAIPLLPLLLRGLLCNLLVCLAVWCGFRLKSESARLVMIFWCLFAFITTGYEHSIANMSLLTVALLAPFDAAVGMGGYFYNILVSSLGNLIGGALFLALPYHIIAGARGKS